MLKKLSYLVSVITLFLVIGCEKDPTSPVTGGEISKISGKTSLVEIKEIGTIEDFTDGSSRLRKQVAVFDDVSNNSKVSGFREIVINHNYDSNNMGQCYGTFKIDALNATWEGDWTGSKTSQGLTISATGFNLNDRDEYCEWKYTFPSDKEGEIGSYSARIYSQRF